MNAGSLRDRVTIKSPPTAQDAAGQPTGSWSTVATVWADVRHPGGLEQIKAGAETSVVKASVRIRHMDGVDAGMQVVCGARTYDIRTVLPDARRVFLDLVCEVVNVES